MYSCRWNFNQHTRNICMRLSAHTCPFDIITGNVDIFSVKRNWKHNDVMRMSHPLFRMWVCWSYDTNIEHPLALLILFDRQYLRKHSIRYKHKYVLSSIMILSSSWPNATRMMVLTLPLSKPKYYGMDISISIPCLLMTLYVPKTSATMVLTM